MKYNRIMPAQEISFQHFSITIKMLNENMDLCLPERDLRQERSHKTGDSIYTNKAWQGRPLNSEL